MLYYPIMAFKQEDGSYAVEIPDFSGIDTGGTVFGSLADAMAYAKVRIVYALRAMQKRGLTLPRQSKIRDLNFGDRRPIATYIPIFPDDLVEIRAVC